MKTKNFFLTLIMVPILLASCNQGPEGKKTEAGEAQDVKMMDEAAAVMMVDTENSTVKWRGTKPTGEHFGTVMINEGSFITDEDGNVSGGKFTIDLTSIVNEDLESEEMNTKLVGHLKSEDFFHVEEFPVAEFEITTIDEKEGVEGVEGEFSPTHMITGNLTMRGVTKSISFPGTFEMVEGGVKAMSNTFVIDRTEWGVNYGSNKIFDNLKDNFINDEMALTIMVTARSEM
jgi:polyisoprenoid-binding protein YceI